MWVQQVAAFEWCSARDKINMLQEMFDNWNIADRYEELRQAVAERRDPRPLASMRVPQYYQDPDGLGELVMDMQMHSTFRTPQQVVNNYRWVNHLPRLYDVDTENTIPRVFPPTRTS